MVGLISSGAGAVRLKKFNDAEADQLTDRMLAYVQTAFPGRDPKEIQKLAMAMRVLQRTLEDYLGITDEADRTLVFAFAAETLEGGTAFQRHNEEEIVARNRAAAEQGRALAKYQHETELSILNKRG